MSLKSPQHVQGLSNDSSQALLQTQLTSLIATTVLIIQNLGNESQRYANMSFAMGAHAAFKVRDQMKADGGNGDKWGGGQQSSAQHSMKSTDFKDNPPAKYNEKMMMSIWGLYNRYSVHNIKSRNSFSGA